jgi:hypothetical protein
MANATRSESAPCGNCGDGCGWSIWFTREMPSGKPVYVWAACADCNDDALKPKPELCEGCAETPAFCRCEKSRDQRNEVGDEVGVSRGEEAGGGTGSAAFFARAVQGETEAGESAGGGGVSGGVPVAQPGGDDGERRAANRCAFGAVPLI